MDIVLFTDFWTSDIYVGQVKSVLHRLAPHSPVFDLAHDLPPFNVPAAAHLLDGLKNRFFGEGAAGQAALVVSGGVNPDMVGVVSW